MNLKGMKAEEGIVKGEGISKGGARKEVGESEQRTKYG